MIGFGDSLTLQDMQGMFSPDRLIRTEISTLFGLLVGVPGLNCASGEERHWTRRAYGTRKKVPA